MNIRTLLSTTVLTACIMASSTFTQSVTHPILFFTTKENGPTSLELISAPSERAHETYLIVNQKIKNMIKRIAQERGAHAVLPYHTTDSCYYIDPACDISDEVFERLNQEYLKSKNQ